MSGVIKDFKKPRLGINVDHVATVRQARGESYPSVVKAAELALDSGADQITIHLREDRRHIQDYDVYEVRELVQKKGALFNFEVGATEEMMNIALEVKPDWICLVPEKREEKTTEGGLNLKNTSIKNNIHSFCEKVKTNLENTKISLFVEAEKQILSEVYSMLPLVDAVEIHTGEYAITFDEEARRNTFLSNLLKFRDEAISKGLGFHGGHGMTKANLVPLIKENIFSEYNIGHWVVAESIFYGLDNVVKSLKNMMRNN
ncbi:MAG: pyridoxine 5'-phosphate synthase [Halobacteriovoraceae bacterium]|nr:pyridoxine 5'-phosphate synthase [Halobacteriovoraceae bacterium]